jgi:hypothetical protein
VKFVSVILTAFPSNAEINSSKIEKVPGDWTREGTVVSVRLFWNKLYLVIAWIAGTVTLCSWERRVTFRGKPFFPGAIWYREVKIGDLSVSLCQNLRYHRNFQLKRDDLVKIRWSHAINAKAMVWAYRNSRKENLKFTHIVSVSRGTLFQITLCKEWSSRTLSSGRSFRKRQSLWEGLADSWRGWSLEHSSWKDFQAVLKDVNNAQNPHKIWLALAQLDLSIEP